MKHRNLAPWAAALAAVASAGFFVFLTLPRAPFGAVVGTGQDEWYNVVRGLRALYERLNPSYFIHPALYYELLAGVFGVRRVALFASGGGGAIEFADRFLTHQAEFLDMARYVSLASGALAVAAAVWLGTVLSGVSAGVLAGLVVASLPVLQELATSIRVDALGLATLLGAAALVVCWHDRPNRHSLFVAAAGIGVATLKLSGALLLLLLPWSEWARSGIANFAPRALGLVKAAGLALAVFLLLNPFVILDLRLFLRWFFFQAQVPLLRHPHAEEPNAARYLILLAQQGRPALVASVLAVAALSTPRRATAALAAFALAYLAGFSLMQSQYDRFALPAIGMLCVAGAAWLCALLARARPWLAPLATVLLAPLIVWSALRAPRAAFGDPGQDYRAAMFEWIEQKVPATATLVIESDTMPLLQTIYDPGVVGRPLPTALRQAFEARHPQLVRKIIKAQYIAAVYNYDPALLDEANVFFLASSQSREFIELNRDLLPQPAAFYDALDARAAITYETGGFREKLQLYAVKPSALNPAGLVAPP